MMAATAIATFIVRQIDGYSIYRPDCLAKRADDVGESRRYVRRFSDVATGRVENGRVYVPRSTHSDEEARGKSSARPAPGC